MSTETKTEQEGAKHTPDSLLRDMDELAETKAQRDALLSACKVAANVLYGNSHFECTQQILAEAIQSAEAGRAQS